MDLIKISNNVQRIAEAIKSVINVDVTIVDKNLNRIAGTGLYVKNIGTKVSSNTVFSYVLTHGEKLIIENPKKHKVCINCCERGTCKEHAEVCCPIKVEGETVGVIGLIAFDKNQKDAILNNKENLMEFLSRMADLIATKLIEENKNEEINLLVHELKTLLDSIDRGVISVDINGHILHFNSKAVEIFRLNNTPRNIKDLIKNININKIIERKASIINKEFNYKISGVNLRGIYNAEPIIMEKEVVGIVFSFNKMNEIIKVFNKVIGVNMETTFHDIIGDSLGINLVKDYAKRASKSTSTVLIQGESGTGKELFARAIHFYSDRKKHAFIPINCAAIPENLLESELFGYEEGAFTGAKRGGKTGKFELANKGTIFLDEIGDMALHLQTKLLRVLQEDVIERVGGKSFIPINVRIIAATNKRLEEKVAEGEFREDLYYRLNVIPLYIPPLRERVDDINIMAEKFLKKFNCKLGKNILRIEDEVMDLFMAYNWHGNVRELENTIEYAVNMSTSNVISFDDLPNRFKTKKVHSGCNVEYEIIPISELEKKEIVKAVNRYGRTREGMNRAAKKLGISRATIYRKMKEYDIK
jgi:transcriptional regulator with PAS, ATPase and Fis domain